MSNTRGNSKAGEDLFFFISPLLHVSKRRTSREQGRM